MRVPEFRAGDSPTLGVELELQLVDASTMALQDGIDGLLAELPPALGDSVDREFHACCVEIRTDVCRNVDEIRRDLKTKLPWVAGAAARRGLLLAWGGTHPFSHWREQRVTSEPRYLALAEYYRETLLRQVTFGLHVHVGVESGEAAIRACDRIRAYLPILLALSSNSPFWCGRSTGLASHRIEVMGSLAAAGIPPRMRSWADYLELVERLNAAGFIESPKDLWWDVRPSPVHGTVEVRICDMPLGLEPVLGLTALIQCLVHRLSGEQPRGLTCLDGSPEPGAVEERARHMVLQQNRWQASRHGLDALLIAPDRWSKAPARVLARELIDHVLDTGRELGCEEYLQNLRGRTRGITGARAQLAVFERSGSLQEVVRLLTRADSSGHRGPSLSPLLIDSRALLDRLEMETRT
jgi:carboxylate-amine ligase